VETTDGHEVSRPLFLSLFAAQSAVISLSPVLPYVAADLDVSTAAAGQLRTVAGLAAGVAALALGRVARRLELRAVMLRAAGLLALGSLLSAVVPSFALLAVAQLVVGVGIGALVAAGTTAAAEWAPPSERTRVLSQALLGPPAAWIVGMPVIGALGNVSWRYGLLALPLSASLIAASALAARPRTPLQPREVELLSALGQPGLARWAVAELFANAGWAGTLVYAGALFVQSYGTSLILTGFVLAGAAAAFVLGNLTFRVLADGEGVRTRLARISLVLAVSVSLFGTIRSGLFVSAALFAAASFVAGGRTLLGNAFGLRAAPERRLAIMGARAASTQFGYFLGAAAGGAALQAGGYSGLGLALGGFFLVAALVQLELGRIRRRLVSVTT
jgi:predicted MFS family arabinose efflux permease